MNEEIKKYSELAEGWIREHREELIEEIRGLVKIPSVSRKELAAPGAPFGPDCRRMLDYMMERGAYYGFRTRDLDGYAAVVASGNEEETLGIIAHLDVVPVGDGWIYPPFEATYLPEHDALIGRGVDDDKGPAAMGLFVMRMLRDLKIPMKHGIELYCGVSEETGMQDMQALVKRGNAFPKLSLVPDAGFPANYAQKGSLNVWITADASGNLVEFSSGSAFNIIPDKAFAVLSEDEAAVKEAAKKLPEELCRILTIEGAANGTKVTAQGVSGHAAVPEGSTNAIMLLAKALTEMEVLKGNAKEAVKALAFLSADSFCISEDAAYSDEVSGKTTLVYSMAGLKDGVLRVGIDSRFSISYDSKRYTEKLTKAWNGCGFMVESIDVSEPFYMPKDDPRIQALQEIYHEITGRDEEPYTMGGGTYSRVVPNAISFGPGLPGGPQADFLPEGHGGAHGRDEVLFLEKLIAAMKIYFISFIMLDRIA